MIKNKYFLKKYMYFVRMEPSRYSIMKINRGSKIKTWGTPHFTKAGNDEHFFIHIKKILSLMQEENYSNTGCCQTQPLNAFK